MKKLTIYLILSLLVFSGCEKDKTEPEEITPTKEELLCREWELEKYFIDGNEQSGFLIQNWSFNKNGNLNVVIVLSNQEEVNFSSEWKWANNKENLEIKKFELDEKRNSFFSSILFDSWTKDEIWREIRIKELIPEELIFEFTEDEDVNRMEFKEK